MTRHTKYGPPVPKPRSYNLMLELLESQTNKKLIHEYTQDIKQWLSFLEPQLMVNPAMIDLQPEIQWFMRPFLLDFLIELHSSFRLQPATLFLCFNIIDRYCAKRIVFKRHYQLVGCTALWIAGKYEDKKSRVPTLKELLIMCRNAYDEEMFVQMEMHILSTLEWSLSHPNLEECLQISIQSCLSNHLQVTPTCKYNNNTPANSKISAITAVGRFLCELSLYDRFFLSVPTSIIAQTANILACSMLQANNCTLMLEELLKTVFKQKYATPSSNYFLTPKSAILNKSPQQGNDSDYEEIFSDEEFDEDEENKQPRVKGAFLSGFDPDTTFDQIRKVALMLIIQLNKVTDVLSKKYEPLRVIEVVKNFHERHSYIINVIMENSNAIASDQWQDANSKLGNFVDVLLQLPNVGDIEQQFKNQQQQQQQLQFQPYTNIPLTPPSATSQYSIFSHSNHTLSSICATPVQPPFSNLGANSSTSTFLHSTDNVNGFSPVVAKNTRYDHEWCSPRMHV